MPVETSPPSIQPENASTSVPDCSRGSSRIRSRSLIFSFMPLFYPALRTGSNDTAKHPSPYASAIRGGTTAFSGRRTCSPPGSSMKLTLDGCGTACLQAVGHGERVSRAGLDRIFAPFVAAFARTRVPEDRTLASAATKRRLDLLVPFPVGWFRVLDAESMAGAGGRGSRRAVDFR